MEVSSGFNISQMFEKTLDSINTRGQELTATMDTLMQGDEISSEQMMAMQFEIGQYNAMMEALSSVTKSLTDMMKSLAQRSS